MAKTEIGHRKVIDIEEEYEKYSHIKSIKTFFDELFDKELEKYSKNGKYSRQIINYFSDMYLILKKMKKILKKDGIFGFFIGNRTVLGIPVPCYKIFRDFFEDLDYKIIEFGYNPIVSRALLKGRNNA